MDIVVTDSASPTLDILPREFERATINALNQSATQLKRVLVSDIAAPTGLKAKVVRQHILNKRADRQAPVATLRASSAGIPVPDYRYSVDPTDTPTRGRIRVAWPSGSKVAAGFINPQSVGKKPLRTKTSKGKLPKPSVALGPSIAALFKSMDGGDIARQAGVILINKYQSALQAQIDKRK